MDALTAAGREAFGAGAGVVRLALRGGVGEGRTLTETRPLGEEPQRWCALRFDEPHPGVTPGIPGAKREGVALYDRARAAAAAAGADEAILADAAGRLVEGARTNVFVALGSGVLVTPPLAAGAVAGVAREIVLERIAEAREAEVPSGTLAEAHEIVCVNAVRGARRLVLVDGVPIGDGGASAWAARLHALLLEDPPPA